MKNCLHTLSLWILCLLSLSFSTNLTAQNVRDGFCDVAVDISCGVALTYQTTVGGSNNVWEYPSCNSYTFSGPDRVYKLVNPSTGTIQVDLTIHTAKLDLDLLLLSDNCSVATCIAQSITSNANASTERITYANAPAGTYYIVVDSETDEGAFDILVTCNTTTGCNLEYTVTPYGISCGANKGAIDIDISWGKAPFKIEWDNADNTTWNSYTTNNKKYKIENLPAGTYVVKITDANGCVVMKNGIIISNSGGSLNATFSASDAPCGSSYGYINVDIAGSSPPYWITVKGPKSGTAQGNSNNNVIKDMPPGNYEIIVEKDNCIKTGWVTVGKTNNLDYTTEVTAASCSGKGSVWVTVNYGNPTYTIEWWHIDGTSGWVQSPNSDFGIYDLKAGEYTIKVTDRYGCYKSKKVTIGGGNDLDFVLESTSATCGSKGSIWVTLKSGTYPFTIEWTGPSGSDWITENRTSFPIGNLVAGDYSITITDKNGCKNTKTIKVLNAGGYLDFALEATGSSCSSKGSIWVTIANGTPIYTVEWWGPGVSKWTQTNEKSFKLPNLGAGEYSVKITDKNGCSYTKTTWITDGGGGLDFTLTTLGASCATKGSIWIKIKSGTPKYSIDITGPGVSKWFESASQSIQVSELPAGQYSVQITDKNGCTSTKNIYIQDKGGNLDFTLEANAAGCTDNGYIWVTIHNGTPTYTVELWGPNNTSFWVQTNSKSFKLDKTVAGKHTIKITDKNGCSSTKYVTVGGGTSDLSLALEVNNAGCGGDDGKIWVTIGGGYGPYDLSWSGPTSGAINTSSKGYQILGLKAGNYTVSVKDQYGCTYSKTVRVYSTGSNLTLALEANSATCEQPGYVWVTIGNGTGPYYVSWTGPSAASMNVSSNGFQISDLIGGTYTINVKDKNGCIVSKSVTVNSVGGDVAFTLEANNGSCGQNGYIWVTINSGKAPYHISWTGPTSGYATSSSGYQISDLIAGQYEVTIKDKNGCSSSKWIQVYGGGTFTFTTEITNAKCGKDGEIWIDIDGGKGPYAISLSGPMVGSTSTYDNKYHFPRVPAGNYTLTIKDANGCIVTKQLTVTDTAGNISASIETNKATCGKGGSAWITISGGTAAYTVSWTGPVSSSAQTNTTGYQILNLPAGTYAIKITDYYGCYTEKSITIYNTGNDLILSLEATSASCGQKGSIWATISGGTAGYSLSWTGPISGSISTGNNGYRIENLPAGSYTVTARDVNGCENTKTINVGSNVQDFSITLEKTDATCGKSGSIWVTINGGGATYTIAWSGPSTGSVATNETGYRLDNLQAGTYTVKVTEKNGCIASKSITINNNGSNIGLTLEATSAACDKKGSIWATAIEGTAGYSFSWTGPVSGSISTGNSGYGIENLPAGSYSVTVRDVNGCESTKSITVKSVDGNLSVDLSTSTTVACEQDGTVQINIFGGSPVYNISYTGPTTGSFQTNNSSYQVNDLQPGNYTFLVKDANGCTASKKITIYSNGSNLGLKLTSTHASCGGKGMIKVEIEGGVKDYIISWYGGGVNGNVTTSNNSFAITDLPIGTYTVKVQDGLGCSKEKTASVNNLGGNIGIQLVPKNDVCGQGGSIEVRISGGTATYQIAWSGPSSGSAQSISSTYQITGLTTGNFSVIVKDASGCEAKEWVAINTGGAVNFNLSATNSECNKGGNIKVNITSGSPNYTVRWTGPSTGEQTTNTNAYKIADLSAGTYAVTVEDSKGCSKTHSIIVYANGTNLSLSLQKTNTNCGKSNGSITATITNGQADFTYSWTGPVSGSIKVGSATYQIPNLPSGNYTVNVVDDKGCIVSSSISINNSGNSLGLSAVGKNASCGQPSSIQVTVSNGQPDFTIEWTGPSNGSISTGSNAHNITNLADGEYVIRVTDASGCSTAQVVIIQSAKNNINFTYESKATTCNEKGSIWLTIIEGKGPYNISWTGPSSGSSNSLAAGVQITDLVQGTYVVTVKDNNGCVISQSIKIEGATSGPTVNYAHKASAVTCKAQGKILITMISGTSPYTISWAGPSSGNRTTSTSEIRIEDLSVGVYEITVVGAGGCGSLSRSITIDNKMVVIGVNGTVTNGVCGGKGSVSLNYSGDRDPYTITWQGTTTGSISVNSLSHTISDLPNGSYTFKVTGFDGCSGQYQATINNAGTSVIADFTYTNSAKKITLGNLSTTGTYAWDFGDGTTSSEMNPTHTYDKNGTYTICLKVTNNCGTANKCKSVTINAVNSGDSSAKVVLGEKSGSKGSVLQLPVRIENCSRLATLSGTIVLGNNQVAQINGLSPSAISPVYNRDNKSFSYLSPGSGMNITEETILFYINVQLKGGVGESSTIDLSSLPVALELTCTENGFSSPITPEVGAGRVSVSNQFTMGNVNGNIQTYWGTGIAEAMVTIQNSEHEAFEMTSIDGDYEVANVPMGYEYTIEPSKDSNPLNGLSTLGLFLTQKYILGYSPEQITSPYQIIAMDANCSGTLTTYDLFVMQQVLIGNISEFPGCQSWVFVNADFEFPEDFNDKNVFPYERSHIMMLDKEDGIADFIGVKVGDVLGRALPSDSYNSGKAVDRNRKVIPLQISHKDIQKGEEFSLTFSAKDFESVTSFQLGLDYDAMALDLLNFEANGENELSSAVAGVNRNQLKISWYHPSGEGLSIAEEEGLFTLWFFAKQNIDNVVNYIEVNNHSFTSELHKQSEEAYRFKLEALNSKASTTFKVHQNTPNPFRNTTSITVDLPEAMDAEIILHDHFGRIVQTFEQSFEEGTNVFSINRANLVSGIYYYTVKAGKYADTKRLLIVE